MRTTLLLLALAACGDDAQTTDVTDAADSLPSRPDLLATDTREPDVATIPIGAHAVALPGKLVAVRFDDPAASGTTTLAGQAVTFHRGRALVTLLPEDAPAEWGLETRAFDESRDLHIEGERVVAAGETLTLAAGTRVLMGPGARIVVEGELIAAGTASEPILLTPDGAAWAAIDVRGGRAELSHTWLVGGGVDADRFAGHSGSDPVLAVVDGTVTMSGGGIVDAIGKAIYSERAEVTLSDVTIARCDTGGEHVESTLTMSDSWVFEIPDADGVFADDDNDGVYLRLGSHILERTVFAVGEDDGIDHNGADLEVRGCWLEGFRHEGIATSNGGRVDIADTVVRDAEQGIEVGYGAPLVSVARTLVTSCGVGLRWGDEYDWEALGTLTVTDSIALQNTVDVKTDDPQQGEAPASAVDITCSALVSAVWSEVGGNVGDTAAWTGMCPPAIIACDHDIGPSSCP